MITMKYVSFISEISLDDIALAGGKAANLGELASGGFPVPPGFSVKINGYDNFLAANGLAHPIADIISNINYDNYSDIEMNTARIRDMIMRAVIPDDIVSEIEIAYNSLKPGEESPLVAVRSSVGTRDLSHSSFPGQMDTYHNVRGALEVLRRVRECWASAFTARAAVTMRAKQVYHNNIIIAPLVQLMVPADTAGVLFTSNPINARDDEMMLDASYGLGEAVVSGTMTPDNYIISKKSLKILNAAPGFKKFRIELDDGKGQGSRRVELSDADASRECLSIKQIHEIAEIGRKIERHYNEPQDIEWAYSGKKLYILQSRRIRGLEKVREEKEKRNEIRPSENPDNVWSRKFGDEYLADYGSPLGYSLLARWISDWNFHDMARLQGRRDLMKLDPFRPYRGHIYFSGKYAAKMMQVVVSKSRDSDVVNWFPPSWKKRMAAMTFRPDYALKFFLSPLRDPRGPLGRNSIALAIHCGSIVERVSSLLDQDYTGLTDEEWRRQFDEACEFGHEHFRIIRWGMGYHNPILHSMLVKLLDSWLDENDGRLYQKIISGLPGTKTAEINRDIWKMGLAARSEAEISNLLKNKNLSYDDIRQKNPGSPFWKVFDEFIKKHGHRAATREISHPRWKETPDVILGFVRAQLHASELPPDPDSLIAGSIRTRLETVKNALEKAGKGAFGFARRFLLRRLINYIQIYTTYRENQRYYLDYILTHMRELLLECGCRFKNMGVLSEPGEIFFMERDEFYRMLNDPVPDESVRKNIDGRYRDYLKWKDSLPATYLYDDIETDGDPDDGNSAAIKLYSGEFTITGRGASHGRIRAQARIITELTNLDQVLPGEILITGNIDPGWTNVFPLIAGLITETGGLLAHGALLARDYGIPAVMGVPGATKIINTGDDIEIDGSTGIIIKKS